MWKIFLLLNFVLNVAQTQTFFNSTNAHNPPHSMNFVPRDLLFLSEMPLEQLLKVKKSIEEIQQANQMEQIHRHDEPALESRIVNDVPQKFEPTHGQMRSSALTLMNIQQPRHPFVNRLIKMKLDEMRKTRRFIAVLFSLCH